MVRPRSCSACRSASPRRDRGADRPERRRQVDHAQGHHGPGAASAGTLTFRGNRSRGLPSYRIARLGLGYVPEDRRIFTDLTVTENLEVGRPAAAASRSPWTPERLFDLFPNLGEMRQRPGGQMSGGEQQMLTIARTLMGNPEAILLDEPSEGLAPVIVQMMAMAILAMKAEGHRRPALGAELVVRGLDRRPGLRDRNRRGPLPGHHRGLPGGRRPSGRNPRGLRLFRDWRGARFRPRTSDSVDGSGARPDMQAPESGPPRADLQPDPECQEPRWASSM